jgi:sigma-B regulation protein RsbU (phosphoserine phosphatase)
MASRLIVAPIAIGSEMDAGLCVLDKPSDFTSNNLKLVTALADAAGGFLERERNYRRELNQARVRRELEIAAEIQSRLLQRQVPSVTGAQIVAFSRPASEVGGDFFDVQVLPGDVVALALGDVTGRGVPAALFMAMARALLRVGLQTTHSPRGAVEHLNTGLAADLSGADMLLTLFVATFDPASGELRAVNCGHSPVLVHSRQRTDVWEADGPPLGMLPTLLSVERSRALLPGDVLVVLSDGFNETRDLAGRLIGIEPLAEAVQRSASQDAAAIAATLHQVVIGVEGSFTPVDDQTLIVMKVE